MASVPLITKTGGYRPPIDLPPLTSFSPDPGEPDNYLVERLERHVSAIEKYSTQPDVDPDTVLELYTELKAWLERLLFLERAIQPDLLPPGIGSLYSIESLLEDSGDSVKEYKRLLGRLEDSRPRIERQVTIKRMLM